MKTPWPPGCRLDLLTAPDTNILSCVKSISQDHSSTRIADFDRLRIRCDVGVIRAVNCYRRRCPEGVDHYSHTSSDSSQGIRQLVVDCPPESSLSESHELRQLAGFDASVFEGIIQGA